MNTSESLNPVTDALVAALDFIRRRHNMGRQVREGRRLEILAMGDAAIRKDAGIDETTQTFASTQGHPSPETLIGYIKTIPEDITLEQGGKYLKEIQKLARSENRDNDNGDYETVEKALSYLGTDMPVGAIDALCLALEHNEIDTAKDYANRAQQMLGDCMYEIANAQLAFESLCSRKRESGWQPIETMPAGEVGLCTINFRADAEMCINTGPYIKEQGYKWWFRVPAIPTEIEDGKP